MLLLKLANFFKFNLSNNASNRNIPHSFSNNKIFILRSGERTEVTEVPGLKVIFKGENSIIEIESDPQPTFINSTIEIGTNCIFSIKKSSFTINKAYFACLGLNSKIFIGEYFSCEGLYLANRGENHTIVRIGNDCMFSSGVYMRTSDGHTIYDINTGKILNEPDIDCIELGNHVWVGNGVKILKNTRINDNCIIGGSSVVTRKFEDSNCIIAGVPAKVVKHNVNWHRKNISGFKHRFNINP